MLNDLKGKRALITGSSTGIGAAVAKELARLGVAVAVHGHKNAAAAEAVAAEIRASGGQAVLVLGDVSDGQQAPLIVEAAVAGLGGLDILINNAGAILERVTNAAFDEAIYEQVYDTNVRSVLAMTKAAYPHLKAAGGGSIINTGSIMGSIGMPNRDAYTAAKGGVVALTKSLAFEYGEHGIRSNVIVPGTVKTPRVMKMLATEVAIQKKCSANLPAMSSYVGSCAASSALNAAMFWQNSAIQAVPSACSR